MHIHSIEKDYPTALMLHRGPKTKDRNQLSVHTPVCALCGSLSLSSSQKGRLGKNLGLGQKVLRSQAPSSVSFATMMEWEFLTNVMVWSYGKKAWAGHTPLIITGISYCPRLGHWCAWEMGIRGLEDDYGSPFFPGSMSASQRQME